ncbi:MAG: hypothetical protein U0996_07030 [Planctomycetaceae bacterium]
MVLMPFFARCRESSAMADAASTVQKLADIAGRSFHGDSEERRTSKGRWSRRGREVPLGKRHLL